MPCSGLGLREHQSTRGLVVLDEKPRAPTPEPRDQEKGTDPKTSLLNVKRLMACLLLWVARFPSCLVLALACARAWSVVPLSGLLLCSWSCAPCGRRPENRSFPHVSTRRTFDQVSLYSSLRICMHSRFEFDYLACHKGLRGFYFLSGVADAGPMLTLLVTGRVSQYVLRDYRHLDHDQRDLGGKPCIFSAALALAAFLFRRSVGVDC